MYQQELNQFRATRASTLKLAAPLTEEQAAFTPAPGKWSAAEVLDHLLLAEQLYRDRFVKLIEKAKAGEVTEIQSSFDEINTSIMFIPKAMLPALELPFRMMNAFLPPLVRETLTRNRIMPAQAPSIAEPRKRPLAELRPALEASLAQTQALLDANPNLDYTSMKMSHPLMGSNNVLQLMRIMRLHEERHQDQIRNVMRSPAFPKAA
jgi:uncharacterized damage-inducible protein DinB